jgi:hypothetical protein
MAISVLYFVSLLIVGFVIWWLRLLFWDHFVTLWGLLLSLFYSVWRISWDRAWERSFASEILVADIVVVYTMFELWQFKSSDASSRFRPSEKWQ